MLLGETPPGGWAVLAPVLHVLDDDETLWIVSSDFTHYGIRFDYLPFPPTGPGDVADRLRKLDRGAIEAAVAGDAGRFEDYVEDTGATICGRAPIAAFLHAFGEDLEGELLDYRTSLDVTGDFEHSVSYAAIAFRARDTRDAA
jgi:AmmeMemoRadiSam system protein B